MEVTNYYAVLIILIVVFLFGVLSFILLLRDQGYTVLQDNFLVASSIIFGLLGGIVLLVFTFKGGKPIEDKIIFYPEEIFVIFYDTEVNLFHDNFKYRTQSKDKYYSIKKEFFIIELIQYSNLYGTIICREPILIQKEEKQIKPSDPIKL